MFMHIASIQQRLDLLKHGTLSQTSSQTEACNFQLPLKTHQKAMICAMKDLEDGRVKTQHGGWTLHTNIGICADSTGAGKSIEILAHLSEKPVHLPTDRLVDHFGSFAYFKASATHQCIQTNLIVVPHSCVTQWTEYITNHTTLPLTVVSKRRDIERYNINLHFNQKGITLCSSSMYNEFIVTHNHMYTRVIFDEADTISIPAAKVPDANFVWFVTSSLQNLFFPSGSYLVNYQLPGSTRTMISRKYIDGIRRNGYIRDTFRLLETDKANALLSCIVLKNSDNFIKDSFQLPEPISNTVVCNTPAYVRVLNGNVSSSIMSMLNAGNISGAIEKVGCAVDTFDNIVNGVTQLYKEKMTNHEREIAYLRSLEYSRAQDIDSRNRRIASIEEAVASIKTKIDSISKRMAEYKDGICKVCLEDFEQPTVTCCCQNVFCFECITRSLRSTGSRCPMCRAHVDPNTLSVIDNTSDRSREAHASKPTKEQAIRRIVSSSSGKFLVFSSHEQSFILIENALKDANKEFVELKGSISRVNTIINRYKHGTLDILMLNASHYGTGLNLENTTDLIFYHRMAPDMEKQVVGRAQRAGRKSPLNIHYLYHENETASA